MPTSHVASTIALSATYACHCGSPLNHGRSVAPIRMKRALTMAVTTASDSTVESASGFVHTSSATSCDAPPKTSALISTASVSVSPFCAASVPKAAANTTVPGTIAPHRRAPVARPGSDQ